MISESIGVFGHVTADLYEGSDIVTRIEQPNLIVDTGKNVLASRIALSGRPLIEKIAIGSSSLTPLSTQTELDSETARRNSQFTLVEENNIVIFITTFPEGIGTGDVREVGLFDANGTMVSRTVFQSPFNKSTTQFLNITWRLQVA